MSPSLDYARETNITAGPTFGEPTTGPFRRLTFDSLKDFPAHRFVFFHNSWRLGDSRLLACKESLQNILNSVMVPVRNDKQWNTIFFTPSFFLAITSKRVHQ